MHEFKYSCFIICPHIKKNHKCNQKGNVRVIHRRAALGMFWLCVLETHCTSKMCGRAREENVYA